MSLNNQVVCDDTSCRSGSITLLIFTLHDFLSSSSGAGTVHQRQTATGNELLLLNRCLKNTAKFRQSLTR